MVQKQNCKFICLVWEKMNYKQKKGVYRFATGDNCSPSERLLNLWWSSMNIDDRFEIMDCIMEFLDVN